LFAIAKELGLRGLFFGILSSILLLSNPIISYLIYEYLKKALGNYELIVFFSGGFSKMISTLITYPYQMIRTRSI
jgi:solute carrier family 25 (peroxisomal adenine nucleotide transporter), member 17